VTWQLRAALLAALVIASAAAGWGYATRYWRPQLLAAQAERDEARRDVSAQNDALDALREAADKRAATAQAAIDAAATRARVAETHAQQLLAMAVPQGVDACTAASALIRKELAR